MSGFEPSELAVTSRRAANLTTHTSAYAATPSTKPAVATHLSTNPPKKLKINILLCYCPDPLLLSMNTDSPFRQAELVFQIYLFKYLLLKNNSENIFLHTTMGLLIQLLLANLVYVIRYL
jgi:hypothetical protein